MWDPGFHFTEVRLADVHGYQRRFTLKIDLGRGLTRLSGADAVAGAAGGMLPRPGVPHRRRPTCMRSRRSCGGARCCVAAIAGNGADDTPQGPITALAFVSNTAHPGYVGELPLAETAATSRAARACSAPTSNIWCNWRCNWRRWGSMTPMSRNSVPASMRPDARVIRRIARTPHRFPLRRSGEIPAVARTRRGWSFGQVRSKSRESPLRSCKPVWKADGR